MIFSAEQIRAWDEFTIKNEPVSSLDLMERASNACVQWLDENHYLPGSFAIFCGKGNNGGDGLAVARSLSNKGCKVVVYILEFGHKGTADFQQNLARLHAMTADIRFIQSNSNFPPLAAADIIIDALLGSGLNRPLEGVTAELVEYLNNCGNEIISIDIPSGLFVDKTSKGNTVIRARHTLSFQCLKPAFLVAENELLTGDVHVLDIGLHAGFLKTNPPPYQWIDAAFARKLYRPRKKFAHKGTYGHALLVAGSYGKMGAAVLAAKACLRSGVGLLTMHIPGCGLQIMQAAVAEAMCVVDRDERRNSHIDTELTAFDVVGIGPGIGKDDATAQMLETLLRQYNKPVVLDADALNIISNKPHLLASLPPHSILTPHPKEFERLFGRKQDDFERIGTAIEQARLHQCIVVLKGRHSLVAGPSGNVYFNSTGNPGMATGGTGDVLTGIITGLLAQGYEPEQAAVFGVFWHGLAGDVASGLYMQECMIASDIPDSLGAALQAILGEQTPF
jgi:ADP-dependent NAD(P)H-hydrate dehydratase / NAD(P)H-hydrate epimerase